MLWRCLLVALGGALGATARYTTVVLAQSLFGWRFPLGTLLVNCLGTFLLGLFMSLFMGRMPIAEYVRLFVVVGFLGGYTTYSTFAWETWAFYNNGQWHVALLNLLLTNALTITMLVLGIESGRQL